MDPDKPGLAPSWSPALRLAFRFCFVYFGLYCLTNQILGGLFPVPNVEVPELASLWPVRPVVLWTGAHIFGLQGPLLYAETGSGDRTFDWVLVFCLLVAALLAMAIWTALDSRRASYAGLYKWFRLFIRFALGSELLVYGMSKAIPLQMPWPGLRRLIEPFGNFSPMGVLWSSIGASPAYETFTGCAELLGGILLLIPRTTLLGALISLTDMTQVFAINIDLRCSGEAAVVPLDSVEPFFTGAGHGTPGRLLSAPSRGDTFQRAGTVRYAPRQPVRTRGAACFCNGANRRECLRRLDLLAYRWGRPGEVAVIRHLDGG